MSKHIGELVEAMEEISNAGWHKSTRRGNTGIGKTFEDLLKKEEDNHDLPDFHDIEIKTHETASASMLTMFTKSPTHPRGANTELRNKYGKEDKYGNNILHVTISGNRVTNSQAYDYNFKAEVDKDNGIIKLLVYNKNNKLVDNSVYWSFDALEKQITRKLKFLAIISAESKEDNGVKFYRYNDVDLITELSVESLCEGIENGDIKIDIRIGAYKSGKNEGKTHDHGTGFRINIEKLLHYSTVKNIV